MIAAGSLSPLSLASAGVVADRATEAEALLGQGDADAAIKAFEAAAEAFWSSIPFGARVVTFADSVKGYGEYTAKAEARFAPGATTTIYLEPVGLTFAAEGSEVGATLAIDIEIRTPGGIVLAAAKDVATVTWKEKEPVHDLQATVSLALPDLKPGDYQMIMTLREPASSKSSTDTLPFTVAN